MASPLSTAPRCPSPIASHTPTLAATPQRIAENNAERGVELQPVHQHPAERTRRPSRSSLFDSPSPQSPIAPRTPWSPGIEHGHRRNTSVPPLGAADATAIEIALYGSQAMELSDTAILALLIDKIDDITTEPLPSDLLAKLTSLRNVCVLLIGGPMAIVWGTSEIMEIPHEISHLLTALLTVGFPKNIAPFAYPQRWIANFIEMLRHDPSFEHFFAVPDVVGKGFSATAFWDKGVPLGQFTPFAAHLDPEAIDQLRELAAQIRNATSDPSMLQKRYDAIYLHNTDQIRILIAAAGSTGNLVLNSIAAASAVLACRHERYSLGALLVVGMFVSHLMETQYVFSAFSATGGFQANTNHDWAEVGWHLAHVTPYSPEQIIGMIGTLFLLMPGLSAVGMWSYLNANATNAIPNTAIMRALCTQSQLYPALRQSLLTIIGSLPEAQRQRLMACYDAWSDPRHDTDMAAQHHETTLNAELRALLLFIKPKISAVDWERATHQVMRQRQLQTESTAVRFSETLMVLFSATSPWLSALAINTTVPAFLPTMALTAGTLAQASATIRHGVHTLQHPMSGLSTAGRILGWSADLCDGIALALMMACLVEQVEDGPTHAPQSAATTYFGWPLLTAALVMMHVVNMLRSIRHTIERRHDNTHVSPTM